MRWHIRSQLLLPLLVLLLGVLVLSVWMALAAVRHARRQLETRVRDVGQLLSDGKFPLAPLAQNHVLLWVKQLSGADYLLVKQDGKRISTLDVDPERLPPDEAVSADWRTLHLGEPIRVGGVPYLCGGLRLHRTDHADDILYILYPESLWKDALAQAIWPFVVLGGSVGAASLALAIGLGQGVSRRLGELERGTRAIAAGAFQPLPLPPRNDEIRDLAHSINDLAEQLAQFQETTQRSERLRLLGQVSGGLAHQLRNGLTGVRLAIQLFLRECTEQTDTAALEVALRQLTLLETNLKRFLDLGRDSQGRCERCSLPALIREAMELVRPQCRHAGIELRWQPCPLFSARNAGEDNSEGIVLGDAGRLQQLILNVLSNAIEAAGPGGVVEVRLGAPDQSAGTGSQALQPVVLEVFDSGPGPKTEIEDRLFEPFVTGKPEGVGLGLAVARQVAEAHGGTIGWHRQADRTCFRIELPRASSPSTSVG